MWSRSLAGLRCQCCQQQCSKEFVHLCDDCDHNYCIHCVKDLSRTRWFCYECKPTLQVIPREQLLHIQHDEDWNGMEAKPELGGKERETNNSQAMLHWLFFNTIAQCIKLMLHNTHHSTIYLSPIIIYSMHTVNSSNHDYCILWVLLNIFMPWWPYIVKKKGNTIFLLVPCLHCNNS